MPLAIIAYRCILLLSVRREKGTKMIQALLPDPFSPAVNIGDVIVFLAFWVAILIGARNGR